MSLYWIGDAVIHLTRLINLDCLSYGKYWIKIKMDIIKNPEK